ncbi:P-loop containing nucleoside triphosphate hydrolase protein [Haematococcus lacustris]
MVAAALAPLMPGGLAPPPSSYPKLWALVSFLRKYRDRPQFHGIVFCSTRQGAHFLAEALRIAATQPPGAQQGIEPLLGFVEEVALLVGHGVGADDKGRRMPSEVLGSGQLYSEGLAGRGMTAQQQQEVLRAFKVPGRRLLVATNAAEEGLDVPCCEFVVRFSPPSTGTQLLQGRGRARKLGSLYHCLLQAPHGGPQLHGGADNKMHKKSLEEEAALRNVLRSMAE